jgi:hypothetical protein
LCKAPGIRFPLESLVTQPLPVGLEEADKEVQVTVEPLATRKPMSQEEWRAWVDAMAGTWQGDFEGPPQGEYEEREPLS